MTNPFVLAYLAGIVDADGYVTITRSTRNGVLYFCSRVGISGTESQPHTLAAKLWGGKVSEYRPKNPRHRPQFQWSRSGFVAASIIRELLPHLRVKVAQANLALSLQTGVEQRLSRTALDAMRIAMIALNRSRNRSRFGGDRR